MDRMETLKTDLGMHATRCLRLCIAEFSLWCGSGHVTTMDISDYVVSSTPKLLTGRLPDALSALTQLTEMFMNGHSWVVTNSYSEEVNFADHDILLGLWAAEANLTPLLPSFIMDVEAMKLCFKFTYFVSQPGISINTQALRVLQPAEKFHLQRALLWSSDYWYAGLEVHCQPPGVCLSICRSCSFQTIIWQATCQDSGAVCVL